MVAPVSRRRRNRGLADHLRAQTVEVREAVRNGAKALKEQATEAAGEVKRAVRGEASKLINVQKERAAARIHTVGWAVQKGAGLLHAGKADAVAQYVDMAAQAAEGTSKYLREKELDEIARDVARLARRYPTIAIGGLTLIGFALGRFVQAGEAVGRSRQRGRSGGRRRK